MTKKNTTGLTVYDCSIIELNKHFSERKGNLSVIENNNTVPFDIKRVFYIYDIPGGVSRGAHAHIKCHEFLIAATGGFDVLLDDGINKRTVSLNRPYYGLHIPPGIWASEQNFTGGSVSLVFTSHLFEKDDYIENYNEYLKFVLK